jgi:hypothetical protein
MIRYTCPSCNGHLQSSDHLAGFHIKCVQCHESVLVPEQSTVAAPPPGPAPPEPAAEPEPEPPPPDPERKLRRRRLAAWVLFGLGLGSFFLPWGWVTAMWLGFMKGRSLCAHPGCLRPAETRVPYGVEFGSRGAPQTLGFCEQHAGQAPQTITLPSRRNFAGLLQIVFAVGPVVFSLWFLVRFLEALGGSETAFVYLCWMTPAGIVLLNGACYVFWMYFYHNPLAV